MHRSRRQKRYDNILRLADDPDVRDPIQFLRKREIVHIGFDEMLRTARERLDRRNLYVFHPEFDIPSRAKMQSK